MSTVRPLRPQDPADVGDYVLEGLLGEGGQGTVYLGRDTRGEAVAVKVFSAAWLADPQARMRLEQEVRAMRDVAAFATAGLLEAHLDARPPYVVSEYVPGPSLQDVVRRSGPLTGSALERLCVATLTALMAVHHTELVHRDVKPANVVLGPDGARVVDFGISGYHGAVDASADGTLGTPAYMAPEQIRGEPAVAASDLFSWAGTMVFAATGRPPFPAATQAETLRSIERVPAELRGVPDGLKAVLSRCLDKDPARRPTATEALGLLVAAVDPQVDDEATPPTSAAPAAPPPGVPAWGTPAGHAGAPPARPAAAASTAASTAAGGPAGGRRAGSPTRRAALVTGLACAAAAVGFVVLQGREEGGPGGRSAATSRPARRTADEVIDGVRVGGDYDNRLDGIWFDPQEGSLGWMSRDATALHLVELPSGRAAGTVAVSGAPFSDQFLSPDRAVLGSAVPVDDGSRTDLVLGDAVTGAERARLRTGGRLREAVFTPDGAHLLTLTQKIGGSGETAHQVWRVRDGSPVGTAITSRDRSRAISPDGRYLALAGPSTRQITVWDVARGAVVRVLAGQQFGSASVTFSSDGARLAVSATPRATELIWVWEVASGRRAVELVDDGRALAEDGDYTYLAALAFSLDGSLLAAATTDGRVRLWHVPTRRTVGPVLRGGQSPRSMAFSPDGSTLVVQRTDRSLTLLPVPAAGTPSPTTSPPTTAPPATRT